MASSSRATNPPSTSAASDPCAALHNLSLLGQRMESLRRFLSDSLDGRAAPIAADQMQIVSSEISSTVQHVILNATALLASATSQSPLFNPGMPAQPSNIKENTPPPVADQVVVDAVAEDDDDLDALAQGEDKKC
jgi:hypothetical protein